MQVQEAIIEIYPDLHPFEIITSGRAKPFEVVDNELVSWDNDYPEPTEGELADAWLSLVKKRKLAEFREQARSEQYGVLVDALIEVSDAPRTGAPASMPNVAQLKSSRDKLARAVSATQAVDKSKHGGDALKAANAAENLKWQDL